MSAYDQLNSSKRKIVEVKKSKIPGAGKGLFARKPISNGTPVVIYHGDIIMEDDLYALYVEKNSEWKKLTPDLRGTINGFSVLGNRENKEQHLWGVWVNDVGRINVKKDEVDENVLATYVSTAFKCNLQVVDTTDYPIYVANRKIKKGEELYVHYGIGYWLQQIGCTAEELDELNAKYDFSSFYR